MARQIPRTALVLVAVVAATVATAISPASAAGSCLVKNRTSGMEYARSTGASLQEAIDAALEGEVLVVRGRCVGSFVSERTLTIVGVATARFPTATIDADGRTAGLWINAGNVTLRRLIITGGAGSPEAGGIVNGGGGNLVLSHTWVTDNTGTQWGGGIYHLGGKLTLRDSRVSHNTTEIGAGGGIWSQGEIVLLGDSSVDHNNGNVGGGIHNGYTLDMYDSSIVRENVSFNSGGGIIAGAVTLHDSSRVSGNRAGTMTGHTTVGGGIGYAHTLVMEDSSIVSRNVAYLGGGGVCTDSGSVPYTIVVTDDARIVHNVAPQGGGICSYGADVTLSGNAMVASNTARRHGGGIWFLEGSLTMSEGALVTLNTARGGDPTAPDGEGGGVRTCDTVLTGVTAGVNVVDNVPNDITDCRS